ncbi:cupin domain-containing protein [Agromyces hippuratus]
MSITRVASTETRSSGTATSAMETLASPTVGGSNRTSLWRVRMSAGQPGPRHIIDSEQIWTVLTGEASFHSESDQFAVTAGDTVIVPADVVRTVIASSDCEFLVCGSPSAVASIPGSDAAPVAPPWVR